MIKKESTISISKKESTEIQKILSIESGCYKDCGEFETIETYTAKFDNGFEADIKVCNGDTPYIDPVLFNEFGSEVCVLEVADELLGEYLFTDDEIEYLVNVVEV